MPGMDPAYKSKLFMTGDSSTKRDKSNGRKATRKAQAKEEDKTRSNSSVAQGRGVSRKDENFGEYVSDKKKFHSSMDNHAQRQVDEGRKARLFDCLNAEINSASSDMKDVAAIVFGNPDIWNDVEAYKEWPPLKQYLEASEKKKQAVERLRKLREDTEREMEEANENSKKKRSHSEMGSSVPSQILAEQVDEDNTEEKESDNDDEDEDDE
jgi:hypothetical protein